MNAIVLCGVPPKKSLRCTSLELNIPKSIASDVLHKKLHLRVYKLQLVHHNTPDDRQKRYEFMALMCERWKQTSTYWEKSCLVMK
jgi:hypothetical protein